MIGTLSKLTGCNIETIRAAELGANKRLRRHTTDVYAGSANRTVPDERHLRAKLCRANRGGESCRACADDR